MKTRAVGSKHKDKKELLTAILTLCMLDDALTSPLLDELIAEARKTAAKRISILKPSSAGLSVSESAAQKLAEKRL